MDPLPPPSSYNAHVLTEYVELVLLVEEDGHLSMAELVSRFPSGQRPSSADVGLIRSEVTKRAHLLQTWYPYRADDAGVYRLADRELGIYEFMLLLSLESAPYKAESRTNEANKIFDLLVREAIKARLYPRGEAVRFGTPVQDGRPELFEDAVPWLAEQMGLSQLTKDLPVDDNDCGVDVVAWHPFVSGRNGIPVWLIQGTLQMDYTEKSLQIPVELWKRMIDIGPSPNTALAVPFSVPDGDDRWMKVSISVTSMLDRTRLCEMLDEVDLNQFEELTEMRTFIVAELGKIRHALAFANESDDADKSKAKRPRVAKPRRQRASKHRDPLRR